MKAFVLFSLVAFTSAQLPPLMSSMSQGNHLGVHPFSAGVGAPDLCLSQCNQQCQSASGFRTQVTGVLPGGLRPMGVNRVGGSTTFLQGGPLGPMSGMNMMGQSNPSLVTVSGGNRAGVGMGGSLGGMQGGAMGTVHMPHHDNLMGSSGTITQVTETVKSVQPSGQVSVKG